MADNTTDNTHSINPRSERSGQTEAATVESSNDTDISLSTISSMANWMDNKFRIPGTQIQFGLDPILSILPGLGPVVGSGITATVFGMILYKGVPFFTALRMIKNIIVDFLVSMIPFLGFFFDIGYKANSKNLRLLESHLQNNPEGDYHYGLFAVIALILLLLLGLIIAAVAIIVWLIGLFGAAIGTA